MRAVLIFSLCLRAPVARPFLPAAREAVPNAGASNNQKPRSLSAPPVDPSGIDPANPILFPALRRASARRRLWLGAAAVATFLAIVTAFTTVEVKRRADRGTHRDAFGLDFIAFYAGGSFANEGRAHALFDVRAVKAFEKELARQGGVDLGDAFGPWWNPPFYAWVFAPLAKLPFVLATKVWIGINILCAAVAVHLLRRMLPESAQRDWRTWALIPVLIVLSVPFIHCITHGQNTCTSLLLLTLTVAAWRARRAFAAGLIAGLLFYKPQLGTALGAMLIVSLGRRALAGLAVTGAALLLVTLLTMPGALGQFLRQMPPNVRFAQEACVYPWERHATFKAFWRLLLQGPGIAATTAAVTALAALCVAAVAAGLAWASPLGSFIDPRRRDVDDEGRASPDRLIAATVAATPLLMPFYFDYDLLLLAVPAVLVAGELMRPGRAPHWTDRWMPVVGPAFYAWQLLNADVAERAGVNVTVPLLAGSVALLIARAVPPAQQAIAELDRPLEGERLRAA